MARRCRRRPENDTSFNSTTNDNNLGDDNLDDNLDDNHDDNLDDHNFGDNLGDDNLDSTDNNLDDDNTNDNHLGMGRMVGMGSVHAHLWFWHTNANAITCYDERGRNHR